MKIAMANTLGIALVVCSSLAFLGCAPNAPEKPREDAVSDGVVYEWDERADCAMCHTRESSSLADSQCLASLHKGEGADCLVCHTDKANLATAHEKATLENAEKVAKLRKTKIDDAACLSCHDQGQLISATASAALVDEEGTLVNPHEVPQIEKHADITCGSCHAMHEAGSEPEAEAYEFCGTCHHKDVYRSCDSCHEV